MIFYTSLFAVLKSWNFTYLKILIKNILLKRGGECCLFNLFPFNIGLYNNDNFDKPIVLPDTPTESSTALMFNERPFNSVDFDKIISLIDIAPGASAILNPNAIINDTRQINDRFYLNDEDEASLFLVMLFGQGVFISAVGADIVKEVALLLTPVLDSGIGIDNIASIAALITSINDSGVGADNIVSLVSTITSIIDSGIGVELATVLSTLTLNDSGVGADKASSILASFGITDLGSGLENISVQNFHNVLKMITKIKLNMNMNINIPK